LHNSRVPLSSPLVSRGEVSSGRRRWGRGGLLAAQVGLSLVLLLGAGLLLRSVAAVAAVDPGWTADRVSTFTVYFPPARYSTDAALRAHDALSARLAAMPGTASVGRISGLPLGRSEDVMSVYRTDRPAPPQGQTPAELYRVVDPGYFGTMGISVLRGRNFTDADRTGAPGAVIVSERFADRYFAGEDPLGRPVRVAGREAQVVGVVADVRSRSITAAPAPEMYVPHAQTNVRAITYVVKSAQPPERVLADARGVIQSLDSEAPLIFPETMAQVLDRATARPKFYTLLLGLFAALAVSLAAVGVYGVVAYAVSQRTRETGVRMALGAERGQVVRLMLWQGLRPACAGVAIGLAIALASARVIRGELYGVGAHDPVTIAIVTVLLLAIVGLASFVPALGATRDAPAAVLRGE